MSERVALINAILDNLDDDTPRLVFADWLQEHADTLPAKERAPVTARAEFIRAQIEAAKLPRKQRDSSKPGKKAAALWKKHETDWQTVLGLPVYEHDFVRGFLVTVSVLSCDFTTRAAAMLAHEPVGISLDLYPYLSNDTRISLKWVGELAANPQLKAVRAIKSQNGAWGPERFAKLMSSPHLTNLKKIALSHDVIGLPGVKALVNAPAPFKLEILDLNSSIQHEDVTRETKAAVEAIKLIATSPRLASLKTLFLMFNGLGNKCVKALLASKTLPRTLRLELEDNNYDEEEFEEQLAERFISGSDEEDEGED
jgi:uncharacterized protein (TIGR02996 family)